MLPLVTTMPAFSALSASGVKCGQKICEIFQYCNEFHEDCDDCKNICEDKHHNYDDEICKTQCRGEILFLRLFTPLLSFFCRCLRKAQVSPTYAEMQHFYNVFFFTLFGRLSSRP